MGNGMNKILPGLYVGNYRDARDAAQLSKNKITHILSIHDNAKPLHIDKKYLCIEASDSPTQDLSQYFTECIDFIHNARLNGGGVLVHCLAGVSRSVTVTVVYVMTVTDLGWREALSAVRGSRTCASPNFGFQRQLHEYQFSQKLAAERERLKTEFPPNPYDDQLECQRLIEVNRQWVQTGMIVPSDYSPDKTEVESKDDKIATTSGMHRAELWAAQDGESSKMNGCGAMKGACSSLEPDKDESNKESKTMTPLDATAIAVPLGATAAISQEVVDELKIESLDVYNTADRASCNKDLNTNNDEASSDTGPVSASE